MKLEILEQSKYHELTQFPEFQQYGIPGPLTLVVVARDEKSNEIKGFWVSQLVVHIEPVWIAPEARGGLTGHRMFAKMMEALAAIGVENFYCFSARPDTTSYLKRLGLTHLGWEVFAGTPADK